ncbi:hypothetical protein MHH85_00550 [Viridibacillus sp. FSL E2-0187]|nr:hypothetical protein [Viridibacillus sp. JNUCC-6]QOV09379.1 hypothetical protein JNUCC6_11930 [Viridibacillus sp. JNUCC-6]
MKVRNVVKTAIKLAPIIYPIVIKVIDSRKAKSKSQAQQTPTTRYKP